MKLIETHIITVEVKITERDLRDRLATELIQQAGFTDSNGKPFDGVTTSIQRGRGRGEGYVVRATRDMRIMQKMLPQ